MKLNIFRKFKKEEKPKAAPGERVMELSSRGLSEPEIISSLRKEGYSPSEVDSAMKEALKSGAEGPGMRPRLPERDEDLLPEELLPGEEPLPQERLPPEEEPLPDEELPDYPERPLARPRASGAGHREMERPLRPEEIEGIPRLPEIPGEERLAPPEPELPEEPEEEITRPRRFTPAFEPPGEDIPRLQPRYSSREQRVVELRERRRRQIMELTEELVEEKWVEVEDRIKDIESRFKELEAKISGVEERMSKMKWEKSDEVKNIRENIDSYRDSLGEMNSKLESLEKAVKSSLSPMMESMRSLSDTIRVLKKGRKGKEEEE